MSLNISYAILLANAPIDDYDTDVAIEENDDSSQRISKLHNAKGIYIYIYSYHQQN